MKPDERLSVSRHLTPAGQRDLPMLARHLARYEDAAARIGASPGMRILDLGCGEGYGSRLLAARGANVVGVDASAEALEMAAALWPGVPGLSWSYPATMGSHPCYDAIVALEVMEHVGATAWQRLWGAALATLVPGGSAIVAAPLGTDGPSATNPHHVCEPSLSRLAECAQDFGRAHVEWSWYRASDGVPVCGALLHATDYLRIHDGTRDE